MIKAAIQGERGAFSEIAAKKYFDDNIEILPCYSFDKVFSSVKSGDAEYGVIPIENSLYGSIFETYDLLLTYDFKIQGEINLQINHHLIAAEQISLNEIKNVYSHPQALGQCSEFLKNLDAKIIPAYDTAGSAKNLLNYDYQYSAVIASKEAAEIYNLKIIKSGIQNNEENFTRFLIINSEKFNKELTSPKTTIAFELKSIPGALFKALSVFALRDIDLVKIESRPIPQKPFQYRFYVDLIGNENDEAIKNSISHLEEISLSIKNFGSYQAGNTFKS